MKNRIDLENNHMDILCSILDFHLPPHTKKWIFGSRATGTAKKFSDIDILLDAGSPIPIDVMAKLSQAFEDSILPYKVDIVDAKTISESFLKNIESQLTPISLKPSH